MGRGSVDLCIVGGTRWQKVLTVDWHCRGLVTVTVGLTMGQSCKAGLGRMKGLKDAQQDEQPTRNNDD